MDAHLAEIARNTARPSKGRKVAKNPAARLMAEAREKAADQTPINRTLVLWQEICGANPQPCGLNLDRRLAIREVWNSYADGEAGMRSLFQCVAVNDWLSGRPVKDRGFTRQRRQPIDLFETLRDRLDVIDGTKS